MFPPLLYLVLLFGLLLCFPLGIFPLPVLALKERLYLREQDTGKGFYLVIGNSRTVVIGLLSARHSITPLKLPLVEQVALEYRTVPSEEAASRILGYLFGGTGIIEDDLRKHTVRPAASSWKKPRAASPICSTLFRWGLSMLPPSSGLMNWKNAKRILSCKSSKRK